MAEPSIQLILTLLDQAYNKPTWLGYSHSEYALRAPPDGSNLRSSLRGVGVREALWRPQPQRHCIWEYALHCAYWKYLATGALLRERERGSFPRRPANFPAIPDKPTARAWKEDLVLLHQAHLELRRAVDALEPADLEQKWGRWTLAEHAFGAANHDLYHEASRLRDSGKAVT
jgi:hypothetical protein